MYFRANFLGVVIFLHMPIQKLEKEENQNSYNFYFYQHCAIPLSFEQFMLLRPEKVPLGYLGRMID